MGIELLQLLVDNGEASFLVTVLMVGIYLVYRYLTKCIKEKDALIELKDSALMAQSGRVIELAILWEQKGDHSVEAIKEVNKVLLEIRDALIKSGHLNP